MFKNLKSIAGAAIILAALATSVQARQIDADAPKTERATAQTVTKAQTQSPYFWLVLGVGY
jgi:hypothetical protein